MAVAGREQQPKWLWGKWAMTSARVGRKVAGGGQGGWRVRRREKGEMFV